MIVTNIANRVFGLDGNVNLKPNIPTILPETPDFLARVERLRKAGIVQVEFDRLPSTPVGPDKTMVEVILPVQEEQIAPPVLAQKEIEVSAEVVDSAAPAITEEAPSGGQESQVATVPKTKTKKERKA